MMLKKICTLAFLVLLSLALSAKIELPTMLSDNMVLQQKSDVRLWGKAKANAKVSVATSWNQKEYSTQSDGNGKWLLQVSTPVAGGPFEITISDGEVLTLTNVLIGEVWFCSGQSNMEMAMKGFGGQSIEGANDAIAKAKETTPIRMFTAEYRTSKIPLDNIGGTAWQTNTSANVANCSAIAYYFAMHMQDALDVPIGLIVSSWGGSRLEAWMSRELFDEFEELDTSFLDSDAASSRQHLNHSPTLLYNAKIHPFLNYNIKGMLWYQGESDIDQPHLYRKMKTSFVNDLRTKWDCGEFPFLYVQIAPYQYDNRDGTSSAKFRSVQEGCMETITNSGMVSTMDVGEKNCIHPAKKEIVSKRLAYLALRKTYGREGVRHTAPSYTSLEIKDGKAFVSFEKMPNQDLVPNYAPIDNFEIAGEDKIFYPATARIHHQGSIIEVHSQTVKNPVAVRYAYKNFVMGNVYDQAGLPISSFRTDDWD